MARLKQVKQTKKPAKDTRPRSDKRKAGMPKTKKAARPVEESIAAIEAAKNEELVVHVEGDVQVTATEANAGSLSAEDTLKAFGTASGNAGPLSSEDTVVLQATGYGEEVPRTKSGAMTDGSNVRWAMILGLVALAVVAFVVTFLKTGH
jgi:hypothetical protein